MPWCPKCKSEYEKEVDYCKECNVELVENLKDYVEYVPLVKIDSDAAKDLIEYLNYSGIEDYKIIENDEGIEIKVNKKDFKQASTHLSVYVYNLKKASEENEDTYEEEALKEYETSTILEGDKIKEIRTSAITYYGLGAGILLFTYLNMRDTLTIINPILEGIFLFGGIALLGLGHVTMKKIPHLQEAVTEVQYKVGEMVSWYENTYPLDNFYEYKAIKIDEHDEGALYFVVLDTIKDDLQKQFQDVEMTLINHAAEEIYLKLS